MDTQNNLQRVGDVTLRDLARGVGRYRSVLMLFLAVVLVALALPGNSPATKTASSGLVPGAAAAPGVGGATVAATDTTLDTTPGAAGTTATAAGAAAKAAAAKTTNAATPGAPRTAPAGVGTGVAAGADPNCDAATGRVKFPSVYAPPCVPRYSGNNGGATSAQGVTADKITICSRHSAATPQGQAIAAALGDTDTDQQIADTTAGMIKLFESHYQTWGRHFDVVQFDATGTDEAAYKADAITCAKKIKGFMSWGSPGDAYTNELVADGVLCYCTVTLPADFYQKRAPYVWGTGLPDENQAYAMRAEMIGKQIAYDLAKPNKPALKAVYAGDPSMQLKDRTFGLIWYNVPANTYEAGKKFFVTELAKYNVKLTDDAQYTFDLNTAQNDSQTIMSKFASEGITDVIFVGDPVYPEFFTAAATNQKYFPEWIVTGSALTDTTFFARIYDKDQWKNAFGLGLLAARVPHAEMEAVRTYQWEFQQDPPAAAAGNVIYPALQQMFTGITLAGPTLNPQTFRDGMFSFPVSPVKPGISNPRLSWGRQLWPYDDYNAYDDSTEIYWDATAQGPDETGHNGVGMYRFVNMGLRYLPTQFQSTPFIAFGDNANTVTIYDTLPAQDKYPPYDNKHWYCPPKPSC